MLGGRERLRMFSSRSIMFLSRVLIFVWAFMAMAAAQLHCDPITQYEKDGSCCLKCDPGTHMSSSSTCQEPQCKECEEGYYQENYTTATRCEHQEYCDENKNFKWRDHENKKKRIPCLCEEGFHCSSEVCLTCVAHRNCPPGFGARSIGNHTHDTVCEKCPNGEFSSSNTWNSICQKWNVCESNFYKSKEGTGVSDVECEPTRNNVIPAVLASALTALIVIIVLFVILKRRSIQGYLNVNPKSDIKAHPEENNSGETLINAEEGVQRNPVENEDELSSHLSSLPEEVGVTVNGKPVVQENGKTDVLSRQESQTDTTKSFGS